eukprot:TRINITY_DN998_c0_g1_i2.p1 TRINITY_DN998_c0_g1~~TRINITY_DN998_c0_g1_i2.p1  ORF type:complete len:180 (-),score=45.32 TRINITY_DN998_c0_g1_i2:46-585(-)
MRGDETGLGTPSEDYASIAAVHLLSSVKHKFLTCLGFGIDAFHGVCHAQFLHNVGALQREGGYLGSFSLQPEQPEVAAYLELSQAALTEIPDGSIVNMSIVSAIQGFTGNHHASARTAGSKLFINPLMSQYWCFDADAVAKRCLYLRDIIHTDTLSEISLAIQIFRDSCRVLPYEKLPM